MVIEFPENRPRYFYPEDAVSIDVRLKNVPSLIVSVFELNTARLFRVSNYIAIVWGWGGVAAHSHAHTELVCGFWLPPSLSPRACRSAVVEPRM